MNETKETTRQLKSPYQLFLEAQREILAHKWIQSEKAGKDIGFDRAMADWTAKHKKDWLKSKGIRRNSSLTEIPTCTSR